MSADPIINPESVARHWRLDPVASAWPGRGAGLSAAVFSDRGCDRLELSSLTDKSTHVLTVELSPCRLEFEVEGVPVHDGDVAQGAVEIVRAGERSIARVTGSWRIMQFYLPAGNLGQLAVDLGVPSGAARALEILDPAFRRDAALWKVGRNLDKRLSRDDVPDRLELDELALSIGEHLIRRHSNIGSARERASAILSAEERRAIASLLYDSRQPGLADIVDLLDRPAPEAARAVGAAFGRYPSAVRRCLRRR